MKYSVSTKYIVLLFLMQVYFQLVTAEDTETAEKQPDYKKSEKNLVKRNLNGFQTGFRDGYELATTMNNGDKPFNSREIPHKYVDESDEGLLKNPVPVTPRQRSQKSPKLVIGKSSGGEYRSSSFNSERTNDRNVGVRYGNSVNSRDSSNTSGTTNRGSHHLYGHENTLPSTRHMHKAPNTYEKSDFGPKDITLGHAYTQDSSAVGVYVKNGYASGYGMGMVQNRQAGTVLSNKGDTFQHTPVKNSYVPRTVSTRNPPATRHMHSVPNTYEKTDFGPRDITLGHTYNQDGSATGVYVKNGYVSGYGIGMVRDRQTGTVLFNEGDTFRKDQLGNSGSDYSSGTRSFTRNPKATGSAQKHSVTEDSHRNGARAFSKASGFASGEKVIFGAVSTDNESRRAVSVENGSFTGHAFAKI